jgi:release factor glutamine methyltransferase
LLSDIRASPSNIDVDELRRSVHYGPAGYWLQSEHRFQLSALRTVSHALATSGLVPIEARILLAHVVERDRAWLAAHGDAELTVQQAMAFDVLARRRHNGEPVAYLTGRREFYGLDLEITSDVLIPRPESELLVELALMRIGKADPTHLLDLGSGSGAVALAIASQRPAAHVLGVDVSPAAIALARRNAQRLRVPNAEFIESDWFERVPRSGFEVIAANPPYVAEDDPHLTEGDLRFEPGGALRGGIDGLRAIRAIVTDAGAYLASRGWLLFEHGHHQAEAVQTLLRDAEFTDVDSRRDLAGIPRVTFGRRAPSAG